MITKEKAIDAAQLLKDFMSQEEWHWSWKDKVETIILLIQEH